ncbi:hypothetical protein EON66_05780, partial [archaeon]
MLPGSLTGDMPAALVSSATASPQDSAKLFVGTDDGFIMGYQMSGDAPGTRAATLRASGCMRSGMLFSLRGALPPARGVPWPHQRGGDRLLRQPPIARDRGGGGRCDRRQP